MFLVFVILAFELVMGISRKYEEDTSDRQSTCYQTVLTFRIWLREMVFKWIYLTFRENYDKSPALQVSAVFGTREQSDSGRVF